MNPKGFTWLTVLFISQQDGLIYRQVLTNLYKLWNCCDLTLWLSICRISQANIWSYLQQNGNQINKQLTRIASDWNWFRSFQMFSYTANFGKERILNFRFSFCSIILIEKHLFKSVTRSVGGDEREVRRTWNPACIGRWTLRNTWKHWESSCDCVSFVVYSKPQE